MIILLIMIILNLWNLNVYHDVQRYCGYATCNTVYLLISVAKFLTPSKLVWTACAHRLLPIFSCSSTIFNASHSNWFLIIQRSSLIFFLDHHPLIISIEILQLKSIPIKSFSKYSLVSISKIFLNRRHFFWC